MGTRALHGCGIKEKSFIPNLNPSYSKPLLANLLFLCSCVIIKNVEFELILSGFYSSGHIVQDFHTFSRSLFPLLSILEYCDKIISTIW